MPEILLPNNGWRPRPYQENFWDAWIRRERQWCIEVAHRRWGKDDVCLHGTAIKAHERVGNYWHCLPEYAQARKAIWDAVNVHTGRRRIDEAFPHELRESTNEQEMKIKFKIGSTWQVIGSDRYDSLVGSGVAGAVFSEWALANPSAWAYIRPMLVENGGWSAFITTPRGKNHAFNMYNRAVNRNNWFAELSDIYSTGALTKDQLVESLEEYQDMYGEDFGRAIFEQEYECSFSAAILGAFYALEMRHVRATQRITEDCVAIEGAPVHRAWDIGVSDDTSIWWFQVVGGQVRLLDCYSASGNGVDHYAEQVAERRERHGWRDGVDYVPHDAANRQWVLAGGSTAIEAMRDYKLNPQLVPNVSKLAGISAGRETLKRAVFHPRCEDVGVSALESYRREWDDERKTFKQNEVHDWASHPADAFRYLSLAWRPYVKPAKVTKRDPLAGGVVLPGVPDGTGMERRIAR